MPGGRYCIAPITSLNTPAGGFSIERQWATQLSTLLFIYDKLKSDLISARRRVLNQCLEQHVYLAGKASGVGARGRHPLTEITQNIFSLSGCRSETVECDCVCVSGCRGITVIYESCVQRGFLGPLFTFSSLKPWHQMSKSTPTQCKVHTFWFTERSFAVETKTGSPIWDGVEDILRETWFLFITIRCIFCLILTRNVVQQVFWWLVWYKGCKTTWISVVLLKITAINSS